MNRIARFWLVVALALAAPPALLAEEGEPGSPAAEEKPQVAGTGESEAPPTQEEKDAALLAIVDRLVPAVEAARGLAFREEFARKLITPEEVEALARKMLAEELPPEKLAELTAIYARLGFFPPSLDLADSISGMLGAGAAGLYVPEEKTLYLVRGYSADSARMILFHEMIHALEDQHFDLDRRKEEVKDDSDLSMAFLAVVEGSATWLMDVYASEHPEVQAAMMADMMKQAGKQMKMLNEVPLVIVAGMGIYPYGNAPTFLKNVADGDRDRIAEIYDAAPVSTEQVLHPKKYGVDFPHKVDTADLSEELGPEWKRSESDSLGELNIGLLLNEFLGGPPVMKLLRIMSPADSSLVFRAATGKAAAGWDGDQLTAWRGPNGVTGIVWASRWDSPEDAREFATAYKAGTDYKREKLGIESPAAQVEVRGASVLVVEGFPAALTWQLVEAAWRGTTFTADPRDKADAAD